MTEKKTICGECPFCIEEFPDGQEFCRTEKTTHSEFVVYAWEVGYCCNNCGTVFLIADEEIDKDAEDDLRENLRIVETFEPQSEAAK